MPRRIAVLLAALAAFFLALSASAADRSGLIYSELHPSLNMHDGHIDYANKDRLDFFKTYASGSNITEVKQTLVSKSPYLVLVKQLTTGYTLDEEGHLVWVTHNIPNRMLDINEPTFVIALKVRADIPKKRLACITTTLQSYGDGWADEKPIINGGMPYCRSGKRWLQPIVPSKR